MDYTFLMEDDSYIHFEFQTTDKGIDDLMRFRTYEALLNHQTKKEVITYVVYSGDIKNPISEYNCGINTYKSEKILKAIKLSKEITSPYKRDMESILYAFANKFLSGKDLERVKEELRVTEIGKSLIEEGKEEGIKAGEKKKAIEIAKGLLDILSIEIIAQKTGLTVDEVKALKDEVK